MEPWHRFRLLACLAVMLGMLGAGGFALILWGVPERPYGDNQYRNIIARRKANPLQQLDFDINGLYVP